MIRLLRSLERLKLGSKLAIGIGISLLLMVSVGIHSLQNLQAMNEEARKLYEIDLKGLSRIKEANVSLVYMGRALRQMVLATDTVSREKARSDVAAAENTLLRELEEARKRSSSDEDRKLLAEFDARFARYHRNVDSTFRLLSEDSVRAGEAAKFVNSSEFMVSVNRADDALKRLSLNKEAAAEVSAQALQQLFDESRRITVFVLVGGILIGAVFGYVIALSIRRPSDRVRACVEALAAGNLGVEIPHADYPNEIGDLTRAIKVLQNESQQIAAQRWLKTHLAQISSELQTVSTFTELSRKFFSNVAPLLKIGHGVFYLYDESLRKLRLLSGYANEERKSLNQFIDLGQGLIGQCAMERTTIILTKPPADYVRIRSSLGDATPRTIVALPVIRNDRLLAVVELAMFDDFDANDQALLNGILPILAMSVEILERSAKTQRLLYESQEQAKRMETQANLLEEQASKLTAQQDALKATEAWYRRVIESAPDGMVVADVRKQIILANPHVEQMFGYPAGEIQNKDVVSLIAPVSMGVLNEMVQAALHVSESTRTEDAAVEIQGIRKDGTEFPLEIGLSRLPALYGQEVNLCIVLRDITARKLAEMQIRDSEAYNKMLFQDSNRPIVIFDPEKGFIDCNTAAIKMYGYSTREEVLGKFPPDVSAPYQYGGISSAEAAAKQDMSVLSEGPMSFEWRHQRPNGEQWDALVFLAQFNYGGRTLLQFSLDDITPRKAAELSVQLARDELEAILDTADIGVVQVKDRIIVRSNRKVDELFGRAPGSQMGQSTRIWYVNDADFDDGGEGVYSQLSNGSQFSREGPMVRADGGIFLCHIFGRAIDPKDLSKGTVWMLEDVTERRQAEDDIRHAREVAEEATKAKSDFLANMSHEIRTPMNAIIGMSHLALQTELDKKQRNYIEKVNRSAENLLGIINDILDFSKIEAGKLTMEKVDFRLEDVMDHLADLVGGKAEDKGLELLFDTGADVPTSLQGDPLRLGQILINLGNNAVKFTEQGEIVVGIEKVHEDKNGVELHFWVKDSGIGMTAEQCAKMFKSFSQADTSTTRKYGGTGLGLAISKNLVEMMQGRIWVESQPGVGSTFHFHAQFGVQANPQVRRMFRADELKGLKALVVDDNASAREILSTMVHTFGLEVDTAVDGTQALAQIEKADAQGSAYDLVLMDWKMPVMDGVETLHKLQHKPPSRYPAVIMVTAYGRDEAMERARQRDVKFKTVLTKPMTASTLIESIGEALDKGVAMESRAKDKADTNAEVMARLSGVRVMLVEDNEMNQELAMELLSQAQMKVVLANNGQEALDILGKDDKFDCVLMDCQMPVMDGYAATREIRKNPAWTKLPVIAMTANAMAGDKEKVLEAGMWDHIAKPLNVADMFATIAKWVAPLSE